MKKLHWTFTWPHPFLRDAIRVGKTEARIEPWWIDSYSVDLTNEPRLHWHDKPFH
jgi:hypothetical protein